MEFYDSCENLENFSPRKEVQPSPARSNKGVLSETQNRLNILMGSSENEGVSAQKKFDFADAPRAPAATTRAEHPPKGPQAADELDEEESWRERVVVLTKQDHEGHMRYAQDILNDLIHSLPGPDSWEINPEDTVPASAFNATLDNSSLSDYESATDESKLEDLSFGDNLTHPDKECSLQGEKIETALNNSITSREHPDSQTGNSLPSPGIESRLNSTVSSTERETVVNISSNALPDTFNDSKLDYSQEILNSDYRTDIKDISAGREFVSECEPIIVQQTSNNVQSFKLEESSVAPPAQLTNNTKKEELFTNKGDSHSNFSTTVVTQDYPAQLDVQSHKLEEQSVASSALVAEDIVNQDDLHHSFPQAVNTQDCSVQLNVQSHKLEEQSVAPSALVEKDTEETKDIVNQENLRSSFPQVANTQDCPVQLNVQSDKLEESSVTPPVQIIKDTEVGNFGNQEDLRSSSTAVITQDSPDRLNVQSQNPEEATVASPVRVTNFVNQEDLHSSFPTASITQDCPSQLNEAQSHKFVDSSTASPGQTKTDTKEVTDFANQEDLHYSFTSAAITQDSPVRLNAQSRNPEEEPVASPAQVTNAVTDFVNQEDLHSSFPTASIVQNYPAQSHKFVDSSIASPEQTKIDTKEVTDFVNQEGLHSSFAPAVITQDSPARLNVQRRNLQESSVASPVQVAQNTDEEDFVNHINLDPSVSTAFVTPSSPAQLNVRSHELETSVTSPVQVTNNKEGEAAFANPEDLHSSFTNAIITQDSPAPLNVQSQKPKESSVTSPVQATINAQEVDFVSDENLDSSVPTTVTQSLLATSNDEVKKVISFENEVLAPSSDIIPDNNNSIHLCVDDKAKLLNTENNKSDLDFIPQNINPETIEECSSIASELDRVKSIDDSVQNVCTKQASNTVNEAEVSSELGDDLLSFKTPSKASIKSSVNFEDPANASCDNNSLEKLANNCPAEEVPLPTMMDNSESKLAPGSYDVDFDPDFNPFVTRTKMASSPPKGSPLALANKGSIEESLDPFTTRSKISSSPPKNELQDNVLASENGFKENKLGLDIISQVKSNDSVDKIDSPPASELEVKDIADECLNISPSDSTNPPTEENSEIAECPDDATPLTSDEPCFDYDIEFDENFDPFATRSSVCSSPPKESAAKNDAVQVLNKHLTIETHENSFNHENEPVTPVDVTVIENENFFPSDESINVELKTAHDVGKLENSFSKDLNVGRGVITKLQSQDAREAEESSEDSGIQIFMPTKKGSRVEESSNISSRKAQTNELPHNTQGDSSAIEEFNGLNINETDPEQRQFSKSHSDIRDEDTSMKNLSEAGPDIAEFTEEEFKSAVEFFKDPAAFEFLQKAGNSKTLEQSTLARMSLYVKFDPLLKQDSPTRRTSAQLQKETTRATSQEESDLSLEGPCRLIDFSPSPKKKASQSDPPSQEVVEEKANSKMSENMEQISEVKKNDGKTFTEEELNQALKMQELLYQEKLLKKDKQWNEKCKNASKERDQERAKVSSFHESQSQMTQIIAEFEKTIADLIAHKESDRETMQETINQLKKEKDQALEDLQGVEISFANLHRRFEKSKSVVEDFKKNEEMLHQTVEQYQQKFEKAEQKYELLKNHARKTLENANEEIMNVKKSSESESIALNALLKKSEMRISSLERAVQDKTKEATELSSICDELIQKVGHS